MQRLLFLCCLIYFTELSLANSPPTFITHIKQRLHQVTSEGRLDLYLTGYAWHNRFAYDADRIWRYNELAWGGGLGKRFNDEDGDEHNLFAFGFLDSHRHVEPVVGYSFLKIANIQKLRAGLGYALVLTYRADISPNVFPGILPYLSLQYKALSLDLTYIPGPRNVGNVLFIFARWRLDI